LHQLDYLGFDGHCVHRPEFSAGQRPAADANLTDYSPLKKALKSNFMKESTEFLS
jgi:hypothetical protein